MVRSNLEAFIPNHPIAPKMIDSSVFYKCIASSFCIANCLFVSIIPCKFTDTNVFCFRLKKYVQKAVFEKKNLLESKVNENGFLKQLARATFFSGA